MIANETTLFIQVALSYTEQQAIKLDYWQYTFICVQGLVTM